MLNLFFWICHQVAFVFVLIGFFTDRPSNLLNQETRIRVVHKIFIFRYELEELFSTRSSGDSNSDDKALSSLISFYKISSNGENSRRFYKAFYPRFESNCRVDAFFFSDGKEKSFVRSVSEIKSRNSFDSKTENYIVFVHGGVFLAEDFDLISGYECFLAKEVRSTVLHVKYRSASENSMETSFDELFRFFDFLFRFDANIWQRLVIFGDSSAATIVLRLVQKFIDEHRPVPRALVLLSPWIEMNFTENDSKSFFFQPKNFLRDFSSIDFSFELFPAIFVSTGINDISYRQVRSFHKTFGQRNSKIFLEEFFSSPPEISLFFQWSRNGQCSQRRIKHFIELVRSNEIEEIIKSNVFNCQWNWNSLVFINDSQRKTRPLKRPTDDRLVFGSNSSGLGIE